MGSFGHNTIAELSADLFPLRILHQTLPLHSVCLDRRYILWIDSRSHGRVHLSIARRSCADHWPPNTAGLDPTHLLVLSLSGTPRRRSDATRVLRLLSLSRHWVLCTLLLSNVLVNETLPVFLDAITGGGGWVAVGISSIAILLAGEVVPQAVCSREGVRIGARFTGLVRVLASSVLYSPGTIADTEPSRCTPSRRLHIRWRCCSIGFSAPRAKDRPAHSTAGRS